MTNTEPDTPIKLQQCDNGDELFPIVDENGTVIGKAKRSVCHDGSKLLHPVVHLHVFNEQGQLYLQKRPEWKDIQPGKWDTAVGGHIDYGEKADEALLREAKEELNLINIDTEFLTRYVFESARERELVNVYRTTCKASEVKPSDELDGGRFWTLEEISQNIGKSIFTPNFEQEIQRLGWQK